VCGVCVCVCGVCVWCVCVWCVCVWCVCVCGGGPCHHGMARPQFADEGTASNKEGNCEYIEQVVAISRQGVVLQLGVWARC